MQLLYVFTVLIRYNGPVFSFDFMSFLFFINQNHVDLIRLSFLMFLHHNA